MATGAHDWRDCILNHVISYAQSELVTRRDDWRGVVYIYRYGVDAQPILVALRCRRARNLCYSQPLHATFVYLCECVVKYKASIRRQA